MKHLGWALAAIAVALVHAAPAAANRDEHRAWVKEVPDAAVWRSYSKTVGSDQLGKCIIDVKSSDIYFFDVNLFNIHADFVHRLAQLVERLPAVEPERGGDPGRGVAPAHVTTGSRPSGCRRRGSAEHRAAERAHGRDEGGRRQRR